MKRHGVLRDFPRTKIITTGYHIDRLSQRNKIFGQFSGVSLKDEDKSLVVSKILLWLAFVTAVITLILSFSKDINFEQPSTFILEIGVAELILALLAVMFAMLRQVFRWNSIQKLKDHLQHMEDDAIREEEVMIPHTPSTPFQMLVAILTTTWFLSSILLTGGFVLLYYLDKEQYSYLKYTKFSTAIVLFVVVFLDNMMMEALEGTRAQMKVDICRLIIHELKNELCYELKEIGKQQRIGEIEKFIEDNKVFKIQDVDHLKRFNFKSIPADPLIDCGDINKGQIRDTKPLDPIEQNDISDKDMVENDNASIEKNNIDNSDDNIIRGVPSRESLLKHAEEYVVLEMDDVENI